MSLKLKAAIHTVMIFATMIVAAFGMTYALELYGLKAVLGAILFVFILGAGNFVYKARLSELESLEKLNGNR